MNEPTSKRTLFVLIISLCLGATACAAAVEAQPTPEDEENGPLWTVKKTDIPPVENLVWVDDQFRLKKTGKRYMLKPEKNLEKRWGQSGKKYKAKLDQSEADPRVFCGVIEIREDGHRIVHDLSLSVVDEDSHVILYFYPQQGDTGDGCSYQGTHGGLAHAHRD